MVTATGISTTKLASVDGRAAREADSGSPQPEKPGRPRVAAACRTLGVVEGGPLFLDALEVLGPVPTATGWPRRMPAGAVRRASWALTAAGLTALVADHGLVRAWLRRWGATDSERQRRMPGDGDRRTLFTTTRAAAVRR